jgi:FRG domain
MSVIPTPTIFIAQSLYSLSVLVEVIDTWSDFDALVDPSASFQSWAFRGQADASWPMWTSLSRHLRNFSVHPDVWPAQEARMMRIFKRKAHLHLTHVPDAADVFQWLALMQHHGGPTRLLDFTWSPYVAAFFALELANADAAVFALDPSALPPLPTPSGGHTQASLREPGLYEGTFLANKSMVVTLGEPGIMNQRLTAQLGTFVIPGVLDVPTETIVESHCGPDALVKLVLRRSLRAEALRSLYSRNVHNASLFPDLNGLAASLRYELESHWAFDPYTSNDFGKFASNHYAKLLSLSIAP